jgi:hypothetical protein
LEGLAACVVYKLPNPYIPFEQRLSKFIEGLLLPGLEAGPGKLKLKGLVVAPQPRMRRELSLRPS